MKINLKKTLAFLLGLALILGLLYFNKHYKFDNYTPSNIKESILSYGAFAPIIYIILFALVPLTLFPDAVLAIAGGMIFGVKYGFLLTLIGAGCGAGISFCISRFFGRSLVKKLSKDKLQSIEKYLEKDGFFVVILLRLVPLIPFDIISYGAGLSSIKFSHFTLATLIGIIPGVYVYTNLGDKALNIYSFDFILSIAILVALVIISYFLKKKLDKKITL